MIGGSGTLVFCPDSVIYWPIASQQNGFLLQGEFLFDYLGLNTERMDLFRGRVWAIMGHKKGRGSITNGRDPLWMPPIPSQFVFMCAKERTSIFADLSVI